MFKSKKDVKKNKAVSSKTKSTKKKRFLKIRKAFRFISPIGRYFKGAWIELKQVRWPNRKATWGLTLAVILFTVFFVILIILLDAGFKELFKLILK